MCRQTQRWEFAATAKGSWKKQGRTFLESLQNDHGSAKTLISGSAPKTAIESIFVVLSHPVYGAWLPQH